MQLFKEKLVKFCNYNELIENGTIWKCFIAEFIGTMFLVLLGCGSCVSWSPKADLVQISLAFGIAVATIVQCICHVSGGHINPAVSFGVFAIGKISFLRFLFYVLSQCIGAIVGAALLRGFTPNYLDNKLGTTAITPGVDNMQAFGIELFITFVLVFTVFAVSDRNRIDIKGSAPLAIGLAVTVCHLFAIPYTGSSMNPARSFGPAVIMNLWKDHWVYWLSPCLGGALAGILYQVVFCEINPHEFSNHSPHYVNI